MATIPLRDRGGRVVATATVDDDDFARIDRHNWSLMGSRARRTVRKAGRSHTVLMHRDVMGATVGDGISVEHVNGNKLDNRRDNLRVRPAVSAPPPPRSPAAVAELWRPDMTEAAS
jgi:hypothetical protein